MLAIKMFNSSEGRNVVNSEETSPECQAHQRSTPLDSIVFVYLAFGPVWDAMWGQTIIKLASSLLIVFFVKDSLRSTFASPSLKSTT